MGATNVIVGGGISGLLAAVILAERKNEDVLLVERESECGGLLRCFDYGSHGRFDYGMHNMLETGIGPLDSLLFNLLPEHEWEVLDGNRRDLAGLYFHGRLQRNSPFPDLRSLSEHDQNLCMVDFFRQLGVAKPAENQDAHSIARNRFGASIADKVIAPSIQKQFGRAAAEMDVMACAITPMTRVVMFGESVFRDLMSSNALRERLAFPEQRHLPLEFSSGRRGYYPKRNGMYRVVDALLKRFAAAGGRVKTNAQVSQIGCVNGRISEVGIVSDGRATSIPEVKHLVWTSGLPAIAPLLNIDLRQYGFDKPRATVVVNMLLRQAPAMGDLYYFYCYDQGFQTFRVTNFGAYCPGAIRNGFHPVAVELLVDSIEGETENWTKSGIDELLRFGVVATSSDVGFARAEVLRNGFPMPTLRNMSALGDMRTKLRAKELRNLTLLGVLSEERLFFQTDVLAQTYRELQGGG